MPEAASVLIGPAEMALTRMFLHAEIGREIAHRGFQRGLGDAHDVVMRHPLLGAVIGQRQHRAAIGHQLLGALRDRGERVAADQHGLGEIVCGGVDVAAVELVLVGEGDGVHARNRASPRPIAPAANTASMRRRLGDVAMADHQPADLLRQRLDPLLERVALIGEGELGAVRRGRPWRCPRRSSGCWRRP